MSVLSAAEQARDLERVMQMWRALGHTVGSIDVYSMYVRLMLREARSVDYQSLCADRVVQLCNHGPICDQQSQTKTRGTGGVLGSNGNVRTEAQPMAAHSEAIKFSSID